MTSISASDGATPSPGWLRVLRAIGIAGVWLALALLSLWAVGALYVDFRVAALRIPLAVIYVLGIIAVLLKVKRRRWAVVGGFEFVRS
jgi:hypothetical protein